ncbi:MAG TPA: hypothetical protein VFO55_11445 [Gemmatimonadaceae bacterium]|nr:hypothetical protein [Gemmatimonadaceae bacterium]
MRLLAIPVVAAGLLGGCRDGLGPEARYSGRYGLYAVFENTAPPVTTYAGSTRTGPVYSRVEIVADTLEVSADGRWVERSIHRGTMNETTNPVVTYDTSVATGTFTVDGDARLTFRSDPGESNVGFLKALGVKEGSTVIAAGDSLAFQGVLFGGLPWNPRYRRVP